jgi:hypothetical protein
MSIMSQVTGKMGTKYLMSIVFHRSRWKQYANHDVTCISQVKMGEQYTNHNVTFISQVKMEAICK